MIKDSFFKDNRKYILHICCILGLLAILTTPTITKAHWCSNIYNTYARLVVKPETDQVNLDGSGNGELDVRVRNNFPYTLKHIKLRAEADGLTITVDPTESEAEDIRVYTGQELLFTISISGGSPGSEHQVSDLHLQVATDVESISSKEHPAGFYWTDFRTLDDRWVKQDPDPDDVLTNEGGEGGPQYYELNYAKLYDLDCPSCQTDGLSNLISYWNFYASSCEGTSFDVQPPQESFRAGQALAIIMRFHNPSQAHQTEINNTFMNSMDSGHEITRGMAAFFAAYGTSDPDVIARIEEIAETDPDTGCGFTPNNRAMRMAKAGLLLHGYSDQYETQYLIPCANDSNEEKRVRAVCAAALGINAQTMNKDTPITDFLLGYVPTGSSTGESSSDSDYGEYGRLMGSALLQMVVLDRRGGPEGVKLVSFYPEEAVPDNVEPKAPTNLDVQPASF